MTSLAAHLLALAIGISGPRPAPTVPGQPEPPRTRAQLRRAIDSLLAQPEFASAYWGVLVVNAATGDTVYAHNADKLFMPASNMKLVTMGVALARLGADYRWTTTVAARGPVTQGTLAGDLLVVGRGDPSVSDSVRGDAMLPLRIMADSLYAAGLRRVTGQLVAADNAFPGPTLGFGWSWDDLSDPDGAAVDELLFNDGAGALRVHAAGVAGEPPSVRSTPAATWPLVRVTATTVVRADTAELRATPLRAVRDSALGGFVVSGAIAIGDSATLPVTFANPDAAWLAALREALVDRGIQVEGGPTDTTLAVDTLVRMQSPPLRDLLRAVLKPSQNQMAEMTLRTIGLEATGVGRADSAARVVGDQLVAWGASPAGFVIRDGSGLARYDYLAPATIVRVLDAMGRSADSSTFRDALPLAGVDGTLRERMRGTLAQGNAQAKTGSLANTRSLSGYVRNARGATLIFSVMTNNFSVRPAQVTAAQDSIVTWLAGLDGR